MNPQLGKRTHQILLRLSLIFLYLSRTLKGRDLVPFEKSYRRNTDLYTDQVVSKFDIQIIYEQPLMHR